MANCAKKQASQNKSTIKPLFEWTQVSGVLRTREQGKQSKVLLKSKLGLDIQNLQGKQEQNRHLLHSIKIDLQKSLHYESDVGWSWHKSSNLPNIAIKVQLRDEQSGQTYYPPQGAYVRSYFVKMNIDSTEKQLKVCLEDVGIKGTNIIALKKGCGVLNGIRFLSTSYNNEGVRFFILLVIYVQDKQLKKETSGGSPINVISSILSPPVFVDSRKAARDYHGKKFASFVQLFQPQQIDRALVLKKSKFQKGEMIDENQCQISQESITIQNDLNGLFNYLTAPNIRNKVKHPLFLTIKFSNAFKLFYNAKYKHQLIAHNSHEKKGHSSTYSHSLKRKNNNQEQVTLSDVIRKFQKRLIKDIGTQRKTKRTLQPDRKSFIIKIEAQKSSAQMKKICDLLDFINCRSILIVDKNAVFGKQFIQFSQIRSQVKQDGQKYSILATYVQNMPILQRILRQGIQNRNKKLQRQQEQQDRLSIDQQVSGIKMNKMQRMNMKRTTKNSLRKENPRKSENSNGNWYKAYRNINDSEEFFFESGNGQYDNQQKSIKGRHVHQQKKVDSIFSDEDFSVSDEILPIQQEVRKNGQLHDINDFFDFNMPELKEKPITLKSMGQKIESQQQTIKVLTRILEDKVIEQKVNTSMAVAAINEATNLASKAIFNNTIATGGLSMVNAINSLNPITQMNQMNQISQMSQLNQMHPLSHANMINNQMLVSQAIGSSQSLNSFLVSCQADSSLRENVSKSNVPNYLPNMSFNLNTDTGLLIKQRQMHKKQFQLKIQEIEQRSQLSFNKKQQVGKRQSKNILNFPKTPSLKAMKQGNKGKFSNECYIKIDKINQQIHCLEIQNQVNRQKIRNNEQLIQSLQKQLQKDSKRLQIIEQKRQT